MKRTLAIFGDSYADDRSYYKDDSGKICNKWDYWPQIGPSYLELLEQHFDIHRFAVAGSSLHFSLDAFEKNYKNFDHVIFCTTEPGRLEISAKEYNFGPAYNDTYSVYGPVFIDMYKKNLGPFSIKERKFMKSLENFYFPYVWKNDQQFFEHEIAIKKITRLRPDSLVLDCYTNNENSLSYVNRNELINWGYADGFFPRGMIDIRKCHMIEPNHEVLYQALKDYFLLDKQFKISELSWKLPTAPQTFYIKEVG
jgi:hypothetical protein